MFSRLFERCAYRGYVSRWPLDSLLLLVIPFPFIVLFLFLSFLFLSLSSPLFSSHSLLDFFSYVFSSIENRFNFISLALSRDSRYSDIESLRWISIADRLITDWLPIFLFLFLSLFLPFGVSPFCLFTSFSSFSFSAASREGTRTHTFSYTDIFRFFPARPCHSLSRGNEFRNFPRYKSHELSAVSLRVRTTCPKVDFLPFLCLVSQFKLRRFFHLCLSHSISSYTNLSIQGKEVDTNFSWLRGFLVGNAMRTRTWYSRVSTNDRGNRSSKRG